MNAAALQSPPSHLERPSCGACAVFPAAGGRPAAFPARAGEPGQFETNPTMHSWCHTAISTGYDWLQPGPRGSFSTERSKRPVPQHRSALYISFEAFPLVFQDRCNFWVFAQSIRLDSHTAGVCNPSESKPPVAQPSFGIHASQSWSLVLRFEARCKGSH